MRCYNITLPQHPDINLVNFQRWYNNHKEKIELFGYQKEAVNLWLKNGKKGIFAMATGTGKTFTALACYKKVTQNMKNWICVIACPQVHLIQQWKKEVKDFGVNYENLLVADSTNHGWKDDLVDYLLKIKLGYKNNILLFTTHSTLSSKDFIEIISTKSEKYKIILIADEVHGLGSSKNRKGLIDRYDIRIGLSATPSRWFDDFGSQVLLNYFGGIIYKFEIEKAINEINPLTGETYLTPYKYIPKFISLTSYELNNYFEITRNIIKKMTCAKNEEEEEQLLEKLLFKRANILKNAENKFGMLQAILTELSQPINFTLVYCNPEQINSVLNILSGFEIIVHQFTEKEGTKPERKYGGISEREFILKEFSETKYQVLVAMKCLDEGVNIPPARTAILMASSTNPREYIQRIGRVIRRFPGKEFAIIYDIIVTPSLAKLSSTLKSLEWQIFEKELLRAEEIATFAMNNAEALQEIETIKNQLRGWKF